MGGSGGIQFNTPNLDRLAASGVAFDRTYCQQCVCGPSRASVLTGRRPDELRVWNFLDTTDARRPHALAARWTTWDTLPALLKRSGYVTAGFGKTFHGNHDEGVDCPDFGGGDCPAWWVGGGWAGGLRRSGRRRE